MYNSWTDPVHRSQNCMPECQELRTDLVRILGSRKIRRAGSGSGKRVTVCWGWGLGAGWELGIGSGAGSRADSSGIRNQMRVRQTSPRI